MKKTFIFMLLLGVSFACQKTTPELNDNKSSQTQPNKILNQQYLLTGALIQRVNSTLASEHSASMRFESLPDFPHDGLDTILQDALTALICHKTPGAGVYSKIAFTPVFTFEVHETEDGAIVTGADVEDFVNSCIDTIIASASGLQFEDEGTLMVAFIDVVEMAVTASTITYGLDVYFLNETSPTPDHFNHTVNPEELHFPITCPLFQEQYNPVSHVTISLFNTQFNDPNCNPNLRWRQRYFENNNITTYNPPHPSNYGAMLAPGFIWKLMYAGVNSRTVNPGSPGAMNFFYTNYGAYNIWSAPATNAPHSVVGFDMTLQRNGIAIRGQENFHFSLGSYWDPVLYHISYWAGFDGSQVSEAQQVTYTWSEWKWVPIPDPNYWVAIGFDEGITNLLNP